MKHFRFDLRRVFGAAATTLLAVGSLTALTPSANASPVGPCVNLHSFTLDFRTGGDDLRGNSEVIPFFITTVGDIELQHVWGPFGGGTTNSRNVTFLNPNWTVSSCDGRGVKLRMVSHNDVFQTDDNWNMDAFTLYGYSDTGQRSYFLSVPDAFKRFTGSDQWWTRIG